MLWMQEQGAPKRVLPVTEVRRWWHSSWGLTLLLSSHWAGFLVSQGLVARFYLFILGLQKYIVWLSEGKTLLCSSH